MTSGTFITPDSPRWAELLDRTPHDFYHLPSYVQLAAEEDAGEAVAFLAECGDGAVLIPLILRGIPEVNGFDAFSPYGYASPLVAPGTDPAALPALLQSYMHAARARSIVSTFLRLHPLLSVPQDVLSSVGTLVDHGETVVVDLDRPLEAVEKEIRRGYRYDIRKLTAGGLTVRFDAWTDFGPFIDTYHATMRRIGAAAGYLFSEQYFQRLRTGLGDHLHLASVVNGDGDVAAAALITTCGEIAQYHLSGTSEQYLSAAPTKLLLAEAMTWLKERGVVQFHLGGGVGGAADSLFNFKAGFASGRARFSTCRIVVDPLAYDSLVRRWTLERPGRDPGGYFPAYRAP